MSGRTAYKQLVDILAEYAPGRLLDIPAGAAPILTSVSGLGYRVIPVDLFPPSNFQGVRADACEPLPFSSESFDVVLSMEGIEHFENQTGFFRECARVLRPQGHLILTTPNVLHLNARLAALLTGQRLLKQGIINEATTLRGRNGRHLYHGHAYLIDAFRLRYLLRIVGLRLERLRATALSPSSIMLAPLVPAIWLATHYTLWSGRRRQLKRRRAATPARVERELRMLARSSAVLFGKGLIVVARKEEPATA